MKKIKKMTNLVLSRMPRDICTLYNFENPRGIEFSNAQCTARLACTDVPYTVEPEN